MPLSASVLAGLIDGKLEPLEQPAAQAARLKVLTAISEAVVEHIQSAASISGVATGLTAAGGLAVTGTLVCPPGSIL